MAQRCDLTGVGPLTGNHVSHAHNRSKRRQNPNLQTKRVWIPEEKRFVRIKATTRAFRTLDKKGFRAMIAEIARKIS